MAIEVQYFKTGRRNCNRIPNGGEVIGPEVEDGMIDYFMPTTVEAVCSGDEQYSNFRIDMSKRNRVAVRKWEQGVGTYITDFSTPILLTEGQILQIGKRGGRSVDIVMQPVGIINGLGNEVPPEGQLVNQPQLYDSQ